MKKIKIALVLILSVFILTETAPAQEKTSPKEIMEKAHKAAAFLTETGETALEEFNNKKGVWVWKDSYFFVISCGDGTMAAHPFVPHLIGKKLFGLQDVKGNLLFMELCEAAKQPKGGWTHYWWNKPGEKTGSRKISFIMSAANTPYQVAAGIYSEELSVEELNKLIQ